MSSCKDCVHYELCFDYTHLKHSKNLPDNRENVCEHFKNKANFVDLPCKVGDTVYKLCSVNSSIKMGQMWDGRIVETNCDRCGYRNCSCYDIGLRELDNPYFINVIEEKTIYNLEFLVKIMPFFGTIYFNSKEDAEQKLKGGVDNDEK